MYMIYHEISRKSFTLLWGCKQIQPYVLCMWLPLQYLYKIRMYQKFINSFVGIFGFSFSFCCNLQRHNRYIGTCVNINACVCVMCMCVRTYVHGAVLRTKIGNFHTLKYIIKVVSIRINSYGITALIQHNYKVRMH